MVFELPKAKYVIAVSGGVDSVVLLHMLATGNYDSQFVVAHFDHGIRAESAQDAEFVAGLAEKYDLLFVSDRAELGPNASEDQARTSRYSFLRRTLKQVNAHAIITAHHQDDLLETILLHVQRGTGRAGLTPMQTQDILRPLLYVPKKDILQYATDNNLKWREDSTNQNYEYARNKMRSLLTNTDPVILQQLLDIHKNMVGVNQNIDAQLKDIYNYVVDNNQIVRSRFVQLPYIAQLELMYTWFKKNGVPNIQKKLISTAVIAAKTYGLHKKMSLDGSHELASQKNTIQILQK